MRTLIIKSVGVVLAIGSGLPVGKEGPFVHTASAVAEQLMLLPWFAKIRRCPELRQQVLSTACAVGVAAAFGYDTIHTTQVLFFDKMEMKKNAHSFSQKRHAT
jgi:H+/Cl- antiporter ClcA